MINLLSALVLTLRACGGVAPDDTGVADDTGVPDDSGTPSDTDDSECTATYDPEGTVPITFTTWDPADACGTFGFATEEHDATYWGELWRGLQCWHEAHDGIAVFTDATGRCIYFGYVPIHISGSAYPFDDPWLLPTTEEQPCYPLPTCR